MIQDVVQIAQTSEQRTTSVLEFVELKENKVILRAVRIVCIYVYFRFCSDISFFVSYIFSRYFATRYDQYCHVHSLLSLF